MAGRIPQYFLDDLLARVDIIDVVDQRVKLKKTGRNYSACCPFHKEKTPSFSVSPDKQFYYCFGCGASGNAIGFLMDFDHIDFPEAVDTIAGQLGLEVPHEQGPKRRGPDNSELYTLMDKAVEHFDRQLKHHNQSPRAAHYLKQRGLNAETCKAFGIGFAPPGWDNLQKELATSPEKEKQLITTGMLVHNEESNRIYDRFRDRIMFPIKDSRGRYIAFGGRVLGDEKPKYLNSPESPIFHKGRELYGLYEARQANRKLNRVIVVEGYMDVVALAQQGISNSVATLGTATTPDHMQKLFKVVPEVVFCFDGDDAGRRAAWKALESTLPQMEDGRQARFLFLPQGEDPDSMVRKEGPEQFTQRIKDQTLSLDNFLFRDLEDGLDLNTMDGRARLAKLAQPYLKQLPEGMFHQLLIKKLSDITGLDSQYLTSHFEEEAASAEAQAKSSPPAQQMAIQPQQAEHNPPSFDHVEAYADYHGQLNQDHSQYEHTYDYGYIHQKAPQQKAPQQKAPQQKAPQQKFESYGERQGRNKFTKRPARSITARIVSSGYAIRQLLCNPEFAKEVPEPFDNLTLSNDPDSQLLVEMLKTLKKKPELAAGTLIAQWYGTASGIRLQSLAALELTTEPHWQEFKETLDELRKKSSEEKLNMENSTLHDNLRGKKTGQIDEELKKRFREAHRKNQLKAGVSGSEEKK